MADSSHSATLTPLLLSSCGIDYRSDTTSIHPPVLLGPMQQQHLLRQPGQQRKGLAQDTTVEASP